MMSLLKAWPDNRGSTWAALNSIWPVICRRQTPIQLISHASTAAVARISGLARREGAPERFPTKRKDEVENADLDLKLVSRWWVVGRARAQPGIPVPRSPDLPHWGLAICHLQGFWAGVVTEQTEWRVMDWPIIVNSSTRTRSPTERKGAYSGGSHQQAGEGSRTARRGSAPERQASQVARAAERADRERQSRAWRGTQVT